MVMNMALCPKLVKHQKYSELGFFLILLDFSCFFVYIYINRSANRYKKNRNSPQPKVAE